MTEWISVKDQAPPQNQSVLATDGKEQHVVFFESFRQQFCSGSGERCYSCGGTCTVSFFGDPFKHPHVKAFWEFTHWMPLPKPPDII